jgi:hypothetical protein
MDIPVPKAAVKSRALEKAALKGMRPPAGGEEVKLYWANYDQYYIKTSGYLHKTRIQWITT